MSCSNSNAHRAHLAAKSFLKLRPALCFRHRVRIQVRLENSRVIQAKHSCRIRMLIKPPPLLRVLDRCAIVSIATAKFQHLGFISCLCFYFQMKEAHTQTNKKKQATFLLNMSSSKQCHCCPREAKLASIIQELLSFFWTLRSASSSDLDTGVVAFA